MNGLIKALLFILIMIGIASVILFIYLTYYYYICRSLGYADVALYFDGLDEVYCVSKEGLRLSGILLAS